MIHKKSFPPSKPFPSSSLALISLILSVSNKSNSAGANNGKQKTVNELAPRERPAVPAPLTLAG